MTVAIDTESRPSIGSIRIALAISAGALLVRLIDLGGKSLWGDEAYTWWFGTQTLADLWASGGIDPHHPPLYYSVIHWVLPFSGSETALRVPSALASSLTVALIFLVADRIFDRRTAAIAAVIAALSPIDIWYAQEARQAALATCFVLLATYGMTREDLLGRVTGVIGLTAALFTYYISPLAWTAILGVATVLRWRRTEAPVREWLIITVPSIALFWPIQGPHFVKGFDSIRSLGDRPQLNWLMDLTGPGGSPIGILILATVAAALGTLTLVWLLRTLPKTAAVGLALGYSLALALPLVGRAYSIQRVVVVGWPFVILLVAFGITKLLKSSGHQIAFASIMTLSLLASMAVIFLIEKDDWRSAITEINQSASDDDTIWITVFTDEWGYGPYLFYGAKLPLIHAADEHDYARLAGSIDGDLWIVASRTPRDPIPSTGVEAWLDDNWRLTGDIPFHRLTVRRYTEPQSAP